MEDGQAPEVRTYQFRYSGAALASVHGDVTALLNAEILDRTDDGRIVFPFEAVRVEFLLQAA